MGFYTLMNDEIRFVLRERRVNGRSVKVDEEEEEEEQKYCWERQIYVLCIYGTNITEFTKHKFLHKE